MLEGVLFPKAVITSPYSIVALESPNQTVAPREGKHKDIAMYDDGTEGSSPRRRCRIELNSRTASASQASPAAIVNKVTVR